MDFFLFLLVNATLFLRPTELVPALAGVRLFEALILMSLAISLPSLFACFWTRPLRVQPITVCVLGLMLAVPLSDLAHGNVEKAGLHSFEFLRLLLYYLVLIAVVTTPSRLRGLLFWLGVFPLAMVLIAVLDHHGILHIAALGHAREEFKTSAGTVVPVTRMGGPGIFADPNDLSLLIVTMIPLCLYWLTDRRQGVFRLAWLAGLGLLGHGLGLTYSRGGFLALLGGLLTLVHARFGTGRTVLLSAALLPALFLLFAGRMTSLSLAEGTGQGRIQLWREGFVLLKEAPLFGVGMDEFKVRAGQVAHNSFVHCFAELGLFGGTLFFSTFFFALWTLYRLAERPEQVPDAEMRRLRAYLLALLAAYAVGLMSLSHSYELPIYGFLGLATAYFNVAVTRPPRPPLQPLLQCDISLVRRLAVASLGFLALTYLFVQLFAGA